MNNKYQKLIKEALEQMDERDIQMTLNSAMHGVMSNLDTVHTIYKKQNKEKEHLDFIQKMKKEFEKWVEKEQ